MAASSTASVSPLTVIASSSATAAVPKTKAGRVNLVSGLNPFAGLRAQTGAVASLGMPECADRSFARIVGSLRTQGKGRRVGGGGALSSRCNAAGEIFRIAAIINGLVLVGVAVGFVLLRMEAFVEESEAE
ncbi:hypothetical protein MLD38_032095 [Melastoma candidum]|uniref:Uncharacterized protein n=1 Tax=Melastoma candidum TaxID=119954 RepID=A0ACB9M381_9MYRT|nr:hypothetical protein MLD38_032095 [Melastoma candidum]